MAVYAKIMMVDSFLSTYLVILFCVTPFSEGLGDAEADEPWCSARKSVLFFQRLGLSRT